MSTEKDAASELKSKYSSKHSRKSEKPELLRLVNQLFCMALDYTKILPNWKVFALLQSSGKARHEKDLKIPDSYRVTNTWLYGQTMIIWFLYAFNLVFYST